MRAGLLVVLWGLFGAASIVSATILLRACGIALPLSSVLPAPGWSFCPPTPLALSAEAERGAALTRQVRLLERNLADNSLACASIPKPPPPPLELPTRSERPHPQQTALLKPPPQPQPQPKRDLDTERWNNRDLSMLNGCWQLGRETNITNRMGGGGSELCRVPAGRICFGGNGVGNREMTMTCPSIGTTTCAAPITAAFNGDGTLGTTQPSVGCSDGGRTTWFDRPNWLTCRRVSDTLAICRDNQNFEHEFRR